MSDRLMDDRRRALEEAFFTRHNEALVRQLRETEAQKTARGALAAASGIKDDAVLDRLEKLGIGAEALAALTLAPLVLVAWADGSLSAEERSAVLAGAHKAGVEPGGVGHQLVEKWLADKPSPALAEAWKGYTAALTSGLDAAQRHALRDALLGQARAVADAAGGFLGLGGRVSPAERQVMHELAAAFGD
jgi:tellurite resistance protein